MSPFAEFTESGFRSLIRACKDRGYRFVRYGERPEEPHVLWRHDIDVSAHRAFALAAIEAEEGVSSTWFVNPRSDFYSVLDPAVLEKLRGLRNLGHEVGLHFDAAALGVREWSEAALDAALRSEARLLESMLEAPVRVVSWHNPDQSNLLDFQADEIAGLLSAYGASLRRDYVYCSDSNGYWRFRPMRQVIAEGSPRLHLLTHPEWWTPEPLAPSERIDRAIMGRARAVRRDYDALLLRAGREQPTG